MMSSPYIRPSGNHSDRRVASSPPPMALNFSEPEEPSIRPMRLKILYTFDSENKTNCLARWPQILNIQTVRLDGETLVGVLDLKTCIQAIVEASPEIIAKLGRDDYTVYAYDYSEYETPLVSQGMFSRVLAAASSSPSASAYQSDRPVTGRVCKNIPGLFGNGIQETLEVKLRLVPVPSCLQSEYVESMRQYWEMSRAMPSGFDPQAWAGFVKANHGLHSTSNPSRSQSPATPIETPQDAFARVQSILNEGYSSGTAQPTPNHSRHGSFSTATVSGQENARLASPTPSNNSIANSQPAHSAYGQYSRAASRASDRSSHTRPREFSMGSAIEPEYANNDDRLDEGPARKRAKVIKADHPGKSSFGKKADSLRVTASTAASIRVFQPTALRPSVGAIPSLEGPPRVPTPVPQDVGRRRRPMLPTSRSTLGDSFMTSDSGYKSFCPDSDAISPEKVHSTRATESPEDLASSPPVMREISAAPSSPVLPVMPHTEHFGFMDGPMDGLFDDTGDVDLPANFHPPRVPLQRDQISTTTMSNVQSTVQIPDDSSRSARQREEEEAKRLELSRRNARKALGLKRSQTWAGDQPSSDPPKPMRPQSVTRSESVAPKPRSGWDKEKRRKAIQSKLNSSIKAGEMPPFCENCGAIETPTWRKAFSRLHSGDHSQVQVGTEDGAVVAVQVLETNEDGSTKLFKVFKKTRTAAEEEQGFLEVLLCNPCGIWLSNRRCMRPQNLWNNKEGRSKSEASKEKPRKSRAKRKADIGLTQSDFMEAPSEAITLESDSSFAPPGIDRQARFHDQNTMNHGHVHTEHPDTEIEQLPPLAKTQSMYARIEDSKPRDKSGSAIDQSAVVALQRAIQSSPGHGSFLGSAQSPIEVDKQSPNPARRSLFSSPKSNGPLGVSAPAKTNAAVQKPAPKTPNDVHREAAAVDDQSDKENLPPRPATPDDGLEDLFSGFSPKTPSRRANETSKSPSSLFKTPQARATPTQVNLTTGDFFSSAVKAFLHAPRTPTRTPSKQSIRHNKDMTPFTAHMSHLLSENAATSPELLLSDLDHLPSLGTGARSQQTEVMDGGTPSRMFRTADFDFAAFASSDVAMPSSPPAWFGVYEDPSDGDAAWNLESETGEKAVSAPQLVVEEVQGGTAGKSSPGQASGHAIVTNDGAMV